MCKKLESVSFKFNTHEVTMSIQAYTLSGAGFNSIPHFPITAPRDPVSASPGVTGDVVRPDGDPFITGDIWQNTVTDSIFLFESPGTWILDISSTGVVDFLTGDTGTATPSSGSIQIKGTANEITTTGSAHQVQISLPSTITAPGSFQATTTITAGTGITSTTGNIVATAGQVNAGTTMTAGTGITANTGNITATNGNLVLGSAGNKLQIHASATATDSAGTFTLAGAATTVVNCSAVTANSLILLTTQALGTVTSASTLAVTAKSDGVSFTVTPSDATDTSTVAYLIIN